jgi:hypothetical protein
MKTWILGVAMIAAALTARPAHSRPLDDDRRTRTSQDADDATLRDFQDLQQDVENLDEELATLEARDAEDARPLRQRADEIRDDVVYLKVKMRRHDREGGPGTGVSRAEIRDLRRDVEDLRSDIDSRSSVRRTAEVRIPAETELSVRLEESLSSQNAVVEDRFRASIQRPVRVDDTIAIPAGTELRGIVRGAERAQRPQRAGRLDLDFDSLYLDRTRVDLRTSVVSMQDEDAGRDVPRKAGIGAVLGGVIGGLLKGRTGAVIGVLVGGGAVVAQKGEDVVLPEGTILKVRLERAVTVPTVPPRSRRD